MVSDLIVDGRWKLDVLNRWVADEDVCEIGKIPIPHHDVNDKLFWAVNRDGAYTVKSGYYHAKLQQNFSNGGASSSFVCSEGLWKVVWSPCFPPRVQNFIWRAWNGAVATKLSLFRRRCTQSPLCPICGEEEESTDHLLLTCSWAQSI